MGLCANSSYYCNPECYSGFYHFFIDGAKKATAVAGQLRTLWICAPPNINVHLDEKNSKSSVKNNTRNNINSDKTIILDLIYPNSLDYTMLA